MGSSWNFSLDSQMHLWIIALHHLEGFIWQCVHLLWSDADYLSVGNAAIEAFFIARPTSCIRKLYLTLQAVQQSTPVSDNTATLESNSSLSLQHKKSGITRSVSLLKQAQVRLIVIVISSWSMDRQLSTLLHTIIKRWMR